MTMHRRAGRASFVGVLAGTAYVASRWNRMATWGSTALEVGAAMPGDEIIGTAKYLSTHAVTIDAAAEDVWPWLVQMGQGRGGMYSYDWLENLVGCQMRTLDKIDPRLQDLAVGDIVRMVPEDTEPPLRFVVAALEAPYLLVLGPDRSREDASRPISPTRAGPSAWPLVEADAAGWWCGSRATSPRACGPAWSTRTSSNRSTS